MQKSIDHKGRKSLFPIKISLFPITPTLFPIDTLNGYSWLSFGALGPGLIFSHLWVEMLCLGHVNALPNCIGYVLLQVFGLMFRNRVEGMPVEFGSHTT